MQLNMWSGLLCTNVLTLLPYKQYEFKRACWILNSFNEDK